MPKPTYHFISHSHWDREWYKTFETFRLDLVDMINSLLAILEADSDYRHFTLDGQTIVLEDYAAIMPDRVADLRRHIQSGRISIGPWYILPDESLVSGESTVRNLLAGRRAARDFGDVMPVGYIPDSFSHIAMMPAILRGFDMDTAIVYRGFGGEPGQETSEYRWQAPDGSEVLMLHLPPNGYGDAYIGADDDQLFIRKAHELKAILDPRATTPHRLCMNGGDHHFPEPYLPRALRVMREQADGDFIHSSIPVYAAEVKQSLEAGAVELPRVHGELHFGYRYAFAVQSGVYSSRMYLKQANQRCETLLARLVEPLAVYATLAGRRHLTAMLGRAWQLLLQNHPHDSICGCSIDAVHREMMTRFDKCSQVGEAVIDKSVNHLYPDDWDGPQHVLIFNPQFRPVSMPVAAGIEFFRQKIVVGLNPNVKPESPASLIDGFRIVDAGGSDVPFQLVAHYPEAHGLRYSDYSYPSKRLVERFDLLLDARDLPALGFAAFRVEPSPRLPDYRTDLRAGDRWLENAMLRLEANDDGTLNVTDKRTGLTCTKIHYFEDGGDAGDEYNYSYPHRDRVITSHGAAAEIRCVESGPLRATLEIRLAFEVPDSLVASRRERSPNSVALPIVTRVSLYHNQPRLEFTTTVDNRAADHRLRVCFPTGLATRTSYADSQFAITAREQQQYDPADFSIEVPAAVNPMQRGVTVLDATHGATVATVGLPEYELLYGEPGNVAITLLRCVGRLSGGDLLTRPGGESGWITFTPEAQCPGEHTFRYAFIPHSRADFEAYGAVNAQIEAFLLPPRSWRRGGEPPASLGDFGLALRPAALVVSALKPAEDGRGVILRLYNPTDAAIEASLQSARAMGAAWRTQLNERDLEPLRPAGGRAMHFTAAPRQIVSLRLALQAE